MKIDDKALYRLLGGELKRRRIEISLSQSQVADEIGIERTSITNIEAGRQKAPLHVLYELCNVLHVELADILPMYENVVKKKPAPLKVVAAGQEMTELAKKVYDDVERSLTDT